MEKTKRKHFQEQALLRLGEVNHNRLGSKMIIDEYRDTQNIIVRFSNRGNKVKTNYQAFVLGSVKDPYTPSKFGVGYIGEGKHGIYVDGELKPAYKAWTRMLQRCYSDQFKEKYPTYKDATVVPEWHCYQTFADWYDENYYEVDGYKSHLDKDILIPGNKVYSQDTCIFTPSSINLLFRKRYKQGKQSKIGSLEYKVEMEALIKDKAEKFKGKIPQKLYDALINYKVEITD